jgi:hypothetical protein
MTQTTPKNEIKPLATNFKLIEQNRQLQDALFRMKKKLMGLSNMATAAASMSQSML